MLKLLPLQANLRCLSTCLLLIVAFGRPHARADEANAPVDRYAKEGNIPPRMVRLTAEQEAEILKDVRVAEGFEATVFAAPPAVNYPVFVAAAPDGTLYVSSDGNGSLGRDPKRGRVIRLRDLDGDGRADETKVFCEINAPRGLVWDHDRLYLMHPPHLSAFIDHDEDGVADEQKILVKNLAFDYDKRPADHTTNGVSLGVDGWLYIAGGDFGFLNAEGADGTKLTHRGGGVIRVRPDGTGLEIYSTGTRNILEVAISPRMDLFARDNTNDGGGWDVRFHHFTGGDDHGYPRLYKNFADECVAPLADYGGGSGCGAVYVDEPGFGQWNDAPLTADWGTGALWHHAVAPYRSTFKETESPKPLVRMTRPTDADVDGNSRLYCASWKGATFKWEGPTVGYIVSVTPKEFTPKPLPDFEQLSSDALASMIDLQKPSFEPSYRRRMAAQRELLRRGDERWKLLLESMKPLRTTERNLAEHLQVDATNDELVSALSHDDLVIVHIAIRMLGKRQAFPECFEQLDRQLAESGDATRPLRALAMIHRAEVVDGIVKRLSADKAQESRKELLTALCRLHFRDADWQGDSWGTRPDTRGPYYQPVVWSESKRIADVLRQELEQSSPVDAAALIDLMNRNRIQLDNALERIVELALRNEALHPQAISQLAKVEMLPDGATQLLCNAIVQSDSESVLRDAVSALSKSNGEEAAEHVIRGLARLSEGADRREMRRTYRAVFEAPLLQNQFALILKLTDVADGASEAEQSVGLWADAVLLDIAARQNASPEARQAASSAIESAWNTASRQTRLMQAALVTRNHFLDDPIRKLIAETDDLERKAAALQTADGLGLLSRRRDRTPRIVSTEVDAILKLLPTIEGDVARGEQLLTQVRCVTCHTTSKDEVQRGPFLGSIAKTYNRHQLAESILRPNKTIAQGFATTRIETVDGLVLTGFVTSEQGNRVTLRDANSKEFTVEKDEIEFREHTKTSMMPEGLLNEYSVRDLASIVDYLIELAAE